MVNGQSSAVNGQWLVVSSQWSMVSCQWLVVSSPVVNSQWLVVNGQWLMTRCMLFSPSLFSLPLKNAEFIGFSYQFELKPRRNPVRVWHCQTPPKP
ncbi:hypothetical protein H6G89_18115 [Oscillatoria sp. FACHB-1407]|uniref:hypothetical protein n=1 Tax=Oscillatoria sp. FACHB-1407 TaxID=2692847 RepID=UPI001682D4CD|nr:hypothetical protein [Oscillatoria sp. FACHB-1407]MBD2462958.1 hypothetical protein [Oscillatoria sp. FACHB-1407]